MWLSIKLISSSGGLARALFENSPAFLSSSTFHAFNFSLDEIQSCWILSCNSSLDVAIRANFHILTNKEFEVKMQDFKDELSTFWAEQVNEV